MDRNKSEFWNPKNIHQLAKEQNVRPQNFDELFGKGRKLWKNDKELDKFLAQIRARRKAKSS